MAAACAASIDPGWANLFEGIDETEKVAAEYGLTQVVHPHVNTLIETDDEFERFLDNSPRTFCLDTGHLFIGDADPVAIAEQHADRVGLVHIKDVDAAIAARFRAGEFDWMGAIQHGLFPPRVPATRRSLLRFEHSSSPAMTDGTYWNKM